MKELNNIDILFLESVINDVPDGQDHKFSLRYKLRKRQIIRLWERRENTFVHKRPAIRMKYIIIAIITAIITVLAGFGIFKIIEGFRVTDYDIYSMLYVVDDLTNSPDAIEETFYIDMDMSEYDINIICDDYLEYWLEYKKEDIVLSICQVPAAYFNGTHLNTENAVAAPQQISINEWNGVYFQPQHGGHYFIFNTGEYIISYTSNMSKSDIENIVKSTKFK